MKTMHTDSLGNNDIDDQVSVQYDASESQPNIEVMRDSPENIVTMLSILDQMINVSRPYVNSFCSADSHRDLNTEKLREVQVLYYQSQLGQNTFHGEYNLTAKTKRLSGLKKAQM